MKYVTHLTVASEDDKFEDLRERMGRGIHGQAAYGIYWVVAEKIGAQIRPESVSTFLTKTERKWCEMLNVRANYFRKWVVAMNLVGLAKIVTDGKLIKIDMPNILKYCDEYSRKVGIKSGHAPDKLRRDSGTPALPALPEVQDLGKRATAGGSEAPAVAPKTIPKKDACQHHLGCDKRGTIKINGRWYCPGHDPEQVSQGPAQAMK
jgi:hypothetical protein